jgi:hypothetical protein
MNYRLSPNWGYNFEILEEKKSPVNDLFTGLSKMRFKMGLNQRPPD